VIHFIVAAAFALSPAQRSSVDAIVERVLRERHISGLSLAIAREGKPLYSRGYGVRGGGDRRPPDAYTVYRVGSIAKQFAAALIMQDVAAGRVALGAPLRTYLPSTGANVAAVTVAQLLGQTSGIATEGPATLAFDPGTGWLYSNANYALLGTVLENVDGTAYATLLQRRIAGPLALRSTACAPSPFAGNVAYGKWRDDIPCAAAGLVSNAADLVRWLDDLRSGRVMPPDALRAMTTSGRLNSGLPTHYGFGFFLPDWFGYRVAEHPGYVDGFSSQDALVLDDGLEIALLTNAGTIDLAPLTQSLIAIVDAPRDRNLVAKPGIAPQNENQGITAAVRDYVSAHYASLGSLQSLEFIERSTIAGFIYDKYRLTFPTGQWWATVGYRDNAAIASFSLTPVE
jgi:D-alanyl-D-alanine carboxypeptidase